MMPRRHLENAYFEAPFFLQSYSTAFLAPTLVSIGVIVFLGSLAVYGFGVVIHAAAIFLTSVLLIPILKISQKTLFFKTWWWVGDLFLLSAILPVSLPWYAGIFVTTFYLLVARVFLAPNRLFLFSPIALTFLVTTLLFSHGEPYQATVFPLMKSFSWREWLNASLDLIQGGGEASTNILIGGSPGGSTLVILFSGIILGLTHAISFSFAVIYTILCLTVLLVPAIVTHQFVFSQADIIYLQNVFFTGVFLLREPTALEVSRKWVHVFLCAIMTVLAYVFHIQSPWYYGVIFAGLFIPLIELYPVRKIFGHKYNRKYPSFRPIIQVRESAYFFAVSLCLIAITFFLKELL